jgi:hypothetical protein
MTKALEMLERSVVRLSMTPSTKGHDKAEQCEHIHHRKKRSGEEKVPATTLGTIRRSLCSIVWHVNSPPKAFALISSALVSS